MTRETPQGTHDPPAWLGEFEPGDLEPGSDATQTREPVPLDGPLWPSEAGQDAELAVPVGPEPITVSYVEPDWDRPTESWTATGWDRDPDRDPDRDASAGLSALGLVTVTGRRPMRPPAAPARAPQPRQGVAAGLAALVVLALLSAFFAWVTAEPLWLALDHSTAGTVTVTRCVDHGLNRRCVGTFTSADGRFARTAVPIMGDAPAAGTGERAGTPARMTSARGNRAYVDVDASSRAATGVALIMLCALAIVRATGVRRLPSRRARRLARLVALTGPVSLLAAMLALTF
jgi:hypothetical protein